MSIFTDIKTALDGLTLSTYYPNYIPEGVLLPGNVVGVRDSYAPMMKLQGRAGFGQSIFTFACWGKKTPTLNAKENAIAMAAEVVAAIDSSLLLPTAFPMTIGADEIDFETLQVMEPVRYSFWHDDP